jgi:hypothetical protein
MRKILAYTILGGKLEEKRPFRRPKLWWEDRIKTSLKRNVCEAVDWIQVDQKRDQWQIRVNTSMNLQVP